MLDAMQRLFVAIRPPDVIRDRLLALMGGISGARWQDDDQLHLTLRFIGEVDRHMARDVDAALAGVHHPAFCIQVAGLGLFDRRGVPEALWAGITPVEPVHELHKKIDRALARVGITPDSRAFLPHITLARLGRRAGSLDTVMAGGSAVTSPLFTVEHFMLFESRLTPDGAVYSALERYPLSPSSSRT